MQILPCTEVSQSLGMLLASCSSSPLSSTELQRTQPTDIFLHIFTRGTTGKPKALSYTHVRFFKTFELVGQSFDLSFGDRLLLPTALQLADAPWLMYAFGGLVIRGTCLILLDEPSTATITSVCRAGSGSGSGSGPRVDEGSAAHESSPASVWDFAAHTKATVLCYTGEVAIDRESTRPDPRSVLTPSTPSLGLL